MTNKKSSFFDGLKRIGIEEEPETSKPEASAVPAPAAPKASSTISAASAARPVLDTDPAYRKLLEKTSFEATEAGTAIGKYLLPLADISESEMPKNTKFKSAVLQAKSLENLTPEKLLGTFDSLKSVVEQEVRDFDIQAQQFITQEITARQDRISKMKEQIAQLQKELSEVSADLVIAQEKAASVQAQFTAAVQRRSTEIDLKKHECANILKVKEVAALANA